MMRLFERPPFLRGTFLRIRGGVFFQPHTNAMAEFDLGRLPSLSSASRASRDEEEQRSGRWMNRTATLDQGGKKQKQNERLDGKALASLLLFLSLAVTRLRGDPSFKQVYVRQGFQSRVHREA
ncbi:hypothetical protein MRX96_003716 [Rhipicephalus microplus]